MRLEIEKKNTYNCFQNLIAAIAKYYQTDFRMMMLELWGFVYNREFSFFGDRMGLIWNGNLNYRRKLLSIFHGIDFDRCTSISEIDNIHNVVNVNPVAFYLDSFECDWLPFFHKQHRSHLCNIVKVDAKYYYCQDEYLSKGTYKRFTIHGIERMSKGFLIFRKKQGNLNVKKHIKGAINDAIDKYDKEQCLKNLDLFIHDFLEEFDLSQEVKGNNVVESKTIMYLKCLGEDKKNMFEFFEYLSDVLRLDITKARFYLYEQSKIMLNIRNYLIKEYFCKREISCKLLERELERFLLHEKGLYDFISKL